MKNFIKIISAVLAVFSFSLVSCSSTKVIPDNLTARQLIQNGQDAFESKNYKMALKYYYTTLERYGSDDPSIFVEANYEIGHIYMKQKKYGYAKKVFGDLVDLYANVLPGQLPGAYNKLAKMGLEKIPEGTVAENPVIEFDKADEKKRKETAASSISEPVVEEVSSAKTENAEAKTEVAEENANPENAESASAE